MNILDHQGSNVRIIIYDFPTEWSSSSSSLVEWDPDGRIQAP